MLKKKKIKRYIKMTYEFFLLMMIPRIEKNLIKTCDKGRLLNYIYMSVKKNSFSDDVFFRKPFI